MEIEDLQNNNKFSEEQITKFAVLYNSLKNIHNRLIKEGYTIKDGAIISPKKD